MTGPRPHFAGTVLVVCEHAAGIARVASRAAVLLGGRTPAFLGLDAIHPAVPPPAWTFGADDDANATAVATRRFVRLVQALWRADYWRHFGDAPQDILLSIATDPAQLRALALEAQAAAGPRSRVWCAAFAAEPGGHDWCGAALPWDPREQPAEAIPVV